MIDPARYGISVRKTFLDGEWLYRASVAELPDVAEYGETWSEAYELALDTITSLAEVAHEEGREFPAPSNQEDEFSGRVTLRMPKGLHRRISEAADTEGISLNQYIVAVLAYAAQASGIYFAAPIAETRSKFYWTSLMRPSGAGENFHIIRARTYRDVGEVTDDSSNTEQTLALIDRLPIRKKFSGKTVLTSNENLEQKKRA